jgi:hypothetical protein
MVTVGYSGRVDGVLAHVGMPQALNAKIPVSRRCDVLLKGTVMEVTDEWRFYGMVCGLLCNYSFDE